MDLNLAGKAVIVTGGGSNIGRGIVLAFAREGPNVVIADIDEVQAQKVAKEANDLGGKAIVIKTDVTDVDSVTAMAKKTLEQFGKIDVLVNNVGWGMDRLFIEKPRTEWEKEVNINFWGVINCTRVVLDHMIEQKYGKIISISSDAGRMGEYREAVYAGCKGGVIAMSKTLARELGRYGINVNVVCPGMTLPESPEHAGELSMWKSPMAQFLTPEVQEKAAKAYPLRRLGKPQDVANVVVFLASDVASFITGQTISVSGGYTMM
ncbi:MAG: 3-oxoacyl-ACP reductase FabG [Chloroflexi bacterium]|nr:3-oxoacyl-ACP reductase FabG [Chloroflexota bacterium]